jgi:hypothetical protein
MVTLRVWGCYEVYRAMGTTIPRLRAAMSLCTALAPVSGLMPHAEVARGGDLQRRKKASRKGGRKGGGKKRKS